MNEPVFTGELVIGRFYMVPTVRGKLDDRLDDWPVLGPAHEDKEIIGFFPVHYHLDFRFFSFRQLGVFADVLYPHGWPLHQRPDCPELGPVIYRRRKCYRLMPDFPRETVLSVPGNWLKDLEAAYANQALKPGLVCPHRGASLRGLPVDAAGCVVCPLHGLRWNIESGKLVTEGS